MMSLNRMKYLISYTTIYQDSVEIEAPNKDEAEKIFWNECSDYEQGEPETLIELIEEQGNCVKCHYDIKDKEAMK